MPDPIDAEKKIVDGDIAAGNNGDGQGAPDPKPDDGKDKSVPLATFLEMKSAVKKLEVERDILEAKQKAKEEDKLKEDGKLQELIDAKNLELSEKESELGTLKTKADEFEEFKNSKIEEAKSKLGDKWSDEYAKLSLTAIDKLVKTFELKPSPKGDNGATGDHTKIELTAEQKSTAYGMYPYISKEKAEEHYKHNLIKQGKIKVE